MIENGPRLWDGQLWLPMFPYATDDLSEGIYRQPRAVARSLRYVEPNTSAVSNLLVVDVDHTDAAIRAVSAAGSHPMPNLLVETPHTGRAHAIWALREHFTRTEYARRAPLAFAAAATEGLRRALDGDRGYSGLITKNPLHEAWRTEWIHDHLFDLGEIAEQLGANMPPKTWRQQQRHRNNPVGLGRNCCLFEGARLWAYREVRHHFGDPTGLLAALYGKAAQINATFRHPVTGLPDPLPTSELRAIVNSIHRWITTRSRLWADGPTVYEATFSTIQAARGRKSGEARRSRVADRAAMITVRDK
ncbi:replication initiation protein [Nocardia fluminea]